LNYGKKSPGWVQWVTIFNGENVYNPFGGAAVISKGSMYDR